MARLHHDRADSTACMRCNNPVVISPVLSYSQRIYNVLLYNTQERRSRGDSHHLLTLFSLAAHIVAYIPTLYISRCLSLSLYLSSRAPSSLTNTKAAMGQQQQQLLGLLMSFCRESNSPFVHVHPIYTSEENVKLKTKQKEIKKAKGKQFVILPS